MTKFMHQTVKDLSRRWTVRLGVLLLLMISVNAVATREAPDSPASARKTVVTNQDTLVAKAAPAKTAPAAAKAAPNLTRASAPATRPTEKPATGPTETPAAATTQMVTITGCLEQDDETFRLKDTDGTDAPKSRSWKTGFMTKRKASIAVADAANRVKLQSHVGQRVSVTGVLVDREMQVQSLQRVAASCAGNSKA